MKALFIGGTGIISSDCSRLAVERGWDLTLLNRGKQSSRPAIEGARVLVGDATDPASIREAVGDEAFDVVANFRAFTPDQVQADIDLFSGRTGQYVFISSASAYRKPVAHRPITESTPLRNPFWQYSRDKIACEDLLVAAHREDGFPATIVRPSHTYDATLIPFDAGWTMIDRMRRGLPVVVHGDGTSLWVLTHARDFAKGFVPLLGDPRVPGDAVHITTDETLTWDAVAQGLARAAGVEADIVHVSSARIGRAVPDWEAGLLGDKAHSLVFDNSKLKSLVPDFAATTTWAQGAREIVAWYDAHPDQQVVDAELDATLDRLVEAERA
ncbi:SDR family oxidoreductase [Microlunatus flavus]|uniref:Nucleoside-diphosphate-sugar epimerase n=1 Tax=Microlunatus flavus TaxID=1036181 RepID=A0A1H9AGB8_9ACTN|nr:SDR family oxidoreductase [Microlunatus flavus]SEP74998.1 Nucleoside-diphosphate-sugar epimerase [Microlunatus flavus]